MSTAHVLGWALFPSAVLARLGPFAGADSALERADSGRYFDDRGAPERSADWVL